jgi:putative addiction module killer protein
MIELRGYVDARGYKPFAQWFQGLDAAASSKVTVALARMESGNFSNAKSVGSGVFEYKIDFGPGYRIYFGQDGGQLVILLGGGAKKRQQEDIARARECWAAYKIRKKREVQ